MKKKQDPIIASFTKRKCSTRAGIVFAIWTRASVRGLPSPRGKLPPRRPNSQTYLLRRERMERPARPLHRMIDD
ncbi:hypothetical protein M407DRAFT_170712 [Tulasnella calospora MUT 4182]|uniref:Uncharacterized protein n=1 Tax=Tulasnella calospora MUT 4182 TaxID=1051891 RepID=A0A0C3QMZ8_9AGAM|nr:hypothetical protein M407DRAFT_170712 [Tulasnella calospora MUT 4182]